MKTAAQHPHPHRLGRQAGLSLIEVLAAILLVTFGILGLLTLLVKSTQANVSTEDSQRAAMMANEMATTMWINGTINVSQSDQDKWNQRITAAGLPQGAGTVAINGTVARITVTWKKPSEAMQHNYFTDVVLPL